VEENKSVEVHNVPNPLVLMDNHDSAGNYMEGHVRKEVHLLYDGGIVIATSQREHIDIQFGRQLYDHHTMKLSHDQMVKVVEWWVDMGLRTK